MQYVVIESAEPDRWLVCRSSPWIRTTVESDHPTETSAWRERDRLQRQHDRRAPVKPMPPPGERQLVLGFYDDKDAA